MPAPVVLDATHSPDRTVPDMTRPDNIQRHDERSDGAAIKGGQEGPADFNENLADDIVRLVLLVADQLQNLAGRNTVLRQALECAGRGYERRGVRLEHREKVALAGQEALESGKHQ